MTNSLLKATLASAAFLAASITGASANVVFSENFDGENSGASALSFTGFSQFDVTQGEVDIIASGDFTIDCAGGSGSCLDLDGAAGNNPTSEIVSAPIELIAGTQYTFSFDFSGGQVLSLIDNPAFGASDTFIASIGDLVSTTITVMRGDAFQTFMTTFVAQATETVSISFLTPGASDFIGAKLDNVLLVEVPLLDDTVTTPLPGALPLLISGLAGLGFASRRKRS